MNPANRIGYLSSIGCDVGGWNCDQNSASRDAIVILDEGWISVPKAER